MVQALLVLIFLKKLLKKWYLYLSLIPILQGFGVSYFDAEIYFQQNILWYFALVSVFFACYNVWLDQKKECVKLQEDLIEHKNKFSRFEVTAVLKKIYVEADFSFRLIENKRKEVKEELEKLESELAAIARNEVEGLFNFPQPMKSFAIYGRTEVILNKKQLIQYRTALNQYLKDSGEYQIALQNSVSKGIKDCYLVEFYIKNTSKVFDENVDLSVNISSENSFLESNYLSDLLSTYLDIPKRGSFNKNKGVFLTPNHNHYLESDKIIRALNNQNLNSFYKYLEIKKHGFNINIKELKANESVKVTRKAFVAKLSNFEMIQYNVSSVFSGQNLSGSIVVDLDDVGVSYQEIIMNQEVNYLEYEE